MSDKVQQVFNQLKELLAELREREIQDRRLGVAAVLDLQSLQALWALEDEAQTLIEGFWVYDGSEGRDCSRAKDLGRRAAAWARKAPATGAVLEAALRLEKAADEALRGLVLESRPQRRERQARKGLGWRVAKRFARALAASGWGSYWKDPHEVELLAKEGEEYDEVIAARWAIRLAEKGKADEADPESRAYARVLLRAEGRENTEVYRRLGGR